MKRGLRRAGQLAVLCAVVVIAVGVLVGCRPKADHWLVIHDGNGAEGQPWTGCTAGGEIDAIKWLPPCLDLKKGERLGFVNYSKRAVTIKHFKTVKESTGTIKLEPGEAKVFQVVVEGRRVQFQISSTLDHGGPDTIVRP